MIDLVRMQRLDVYPLQDNDKIYIVHKDKIKIGNRAQWSAERGFINITEDDDTDGTVLWDGHRPPLDIDNHWAFDCKHFNIRLEVTNQERSVRATDLCGRESVWPHTNINGIFVTEEITPEKTPHAYTMRAGENRLCLTDAF